MFHDDETRLRHMLDAARKARECKRSVEAWNMSCVVLLTQDTLPIFA